MMTSFCNEKVHPILCLPNSKDNGTLLDFSGPRRNVFTACSIGGGNSSPKPTNYPMTPPGAAKKDPGGIGFLDEVGGSVDGLMSCTESLGFESSDERTVDEQIMDHLNNRDESPLFSTKTNIMAGTNSRCWQRSNLAEKKEKKEFPPPLSSLSQDGKPNFYLRAVRKDGRLELTEVKIDRPETLLASRQDGRLRLHLVRDLKVEEETEHENEDFAVKTEEDVNDEEEVRETDEENEEEEEEEEEERVVEWKFPMLGSGSGDGHRRCYGGGHGNNNPNHHHHHHDLHLWRQRCVTTR